VIRDRKRVGAVVVMVALLVGACGGDEISSGTDPPTESGLSEVGEPQVRLTPIAEVDLPVAMAPRPGTDDLYVAQQDGVVRRIAVADESDTVPVYQLDDVPVLDLRTATQARGERGLLGLAFSPDGERLYVNHTDPAGDTAVAEYTMDGDRADPDSSRLLLAIPQPYTNHNGGQLTFGPDGLLYIGTGDGGSGGDPERRAQDADELLGKILRIDPEGADDSDQPYTVPPDNPFAGGGGAPEIWLLGVRNPWRFSFDTATGDLWVADVGQSSLEEVNRLPAGEDGAGRGANLGWDLREGTQTFRPEPPPPDLVDPVFEYRNAESVCAVTGGYVYRGQALPELWGAYLFGDYCEGEVRALLVADGEVGEERALGVSVAPNTLASFGRDADGEVFVLSLSGTVFKIEPA
jgi:glucose/arabinose dehydrogenase